MFAGEGVATEKLDGTNVRLTVRSGTLVRLEKRRNPAKAQKAAGIVDGWYVDADAGSAEDRWIREAAENTDVAGWPDGEHSVEALGPRIQGNPLGLDRHVCVPFNLEVPLFPDAPRTFAELGTWLAAWRAALRPGSWPKAWCSITRMAAAPRSSARTTRVKGGEPVSAGRCRTGKSRGGKAVG